ncbi:MULTISPECIES: transposase [unclassified Cyanobium]|uniref:IS66 family transposase n=1 Tax=unclassified Cyanobium TaxID=2627006 RepID=UPI0037BF6B3C
MCRKRVAQFRWAQRTLLQQRLGTIDHRHQILQRAVDLSCELGERTPWAQTLRTCRQLLQRREGLWSFLEKEGIEPTNNAAERALRHSVIQRKISHGVQSASGAVCRSRLLMATTTLRQQGRDVWELLEQVWIAHHRGGVMCHYCCQIAEAGIRGNRQRWLMPEEPSADNWRGWVSRPLNGYEYGNLRI